jgi:hypothetical protein
MHCCWLKLAPVAPPMKVHLLAQAVHIMRGCFLRAHGYVPPCILRAGGYFTANVGTPCNACPFSREVAPHGGCAGRGQRGRGVPGGPPPAPRGGGRAGGRAQQPRAPPVPVPNEDFNFEEAFRKFKKEVCPQSLQGSPVQAGHVHKMWKCP